MRIKINNSNSEDQLSRLGTFSSVSVVEVNVVKKIKYKDGHVELHAGPHHFRMPEKDIDKFIDDVYSNGCIDLTNYIY